MKRVIVKTLEEKCEGCDKCIRNCPQFLANAIKKDEENVRIVVNQEFCVACGECVKTCGHEARVFNDDTMEFIDALKKGQSIAVVVAPSFMVNYPQNYRVVFGWLKSLGVKLIYDVSFGADITTLLYIKAIKEKGLKFIISQSCPVVVDSIEKYYPELISYLSPVGSPMHCTAIYLKEYDDFKGHIAALSPCFAKAREFEKTGSIQYNVTFTKLMEVYNQTSEKELVEVEFDSPESLVGFWYPTPGGFKESVEQIFGKRLHIKKVDGPKYIQLYLDELNKNQSNMPNLVDILNCSEGCLHGTATERNRSVDEMYARLHKKNAEMQEKKDYKELIQAFYQKINFDDFIVTYERKCISKVVSDLELEKAYGLMRKKNIKKRGMDCSACGYNSCKDMATAIAIGHNLPENCFEYNREIIQEDKQAALLAKAEMERSQKELSEAYQRLAASEEELRAQYDEIQSYVEKIEYLADHDHLTNLSNRRKFIEKLELEICKNKSGAVILLDIDNFKEINDTMGHVYGDKILKKLAEEFENIADEKVLISRFGGDEFLVLIKENNITKIKKYINLITNIFKNKIIIEENEIFISCSMGIALYPFDSNEASKLIMNADMAMYKVKTSGKSNFMFFNGKMTEKLEEQIKVEKILRVAIKEETFKLLYQPQVCTFTGRITGFEALLRIQNYSISPDIFIPIAEETGMIIEIGRWVTKEAIRQASKWKKKGLEKKPIAINFSVKQLNDIDYVNFLEEVLKLEDLEAEYINIEITESIFLEKKEETIVFLNKLQELGIKIALDDFGTGYSSLSYLTFLPLNKIKLDKTLNDKFLELENIKVMDSLILIAHSLNLEVIAEGIENIEQYKRLKVGGCNYIQGYLFSKPLEVIDVEKIYYDNFLDKTIELK